jgi:hypothetical protein
MPRHPEIPLVSITACLACLAPAVTLLKELNDAFGPPFVQPIANTIETLINTVKVRQLEY